MDAAPKDDPFDYGDDARPDDRDAIAALADLARMILALERATAERKRIEDALAKAKQVEDRLQCRDIPDLLTRLKLDRGTTTDGVDFVMRREIRAALPGHDRVEARMGAIRWLIENGHGGIVKNLSLIHI